MGNESSRPIELNENGNILEKHENGGVNGIAVDIKSNGLGTNVYGEKAVQQNCQPISIIPIPESNCSDSVVMELDGQIPKREDQTCDNTDNTIEEECVKKPKKNNPFDKMFTKKTKVFATQGNTNANESISANHTDAASPANNPQPEPANIKQDSETFKESESVSQQLNPEEEEISEADKVVESLVESYTEEKSVMNFFKTLVTPTKTSKKEKASADAPKDKSQQQIPSTEPSTTVVAVTDPPAAPKGMSIPPPPPPEPPKMEFKGDPAAKPIKATPKEEPKAATKETEASKGKFAKDTLNRFFRSKNENNVELKEEAAPQPDVTTQESMEELSQPVVDVQTDEVQQPIIQDQKVDASKSSTLEAAAKPEVPPSVAEEKKPPSKVPFLSLFKPKAAGPKVEASAQPATTAGTQVARATDEPKASAKPSETPIDNSVSGASKGGVEAVNEPRRKLEKRNSIQLFFKNLGQKRPSTDAGVQTEAMTAGPAQAPAK